MFFKSNYSEGYQLQNCGGFILLANKYLDLGSTSNIMKVNSVEVWQSATSVEISIGWHYEFGEKDRF